MYERSYTCDTCYTYYVCYTTTTHEVHFQEQK